MCGVTKKVAYLRVTPYSLAFLGSRENVESVVYYFHEIPSFSLRNCIFKTEKGALIRPRACLFLRKKVYHFMVYYPSSQSIGERQLLKKCKSIKDTKTYLTFSLTISNQSFASSPTYSDPSLCELSHRFSYRQDVQGPSDDP